MLDNIRALNDGWFPCPRRLRQHAALTEPSLPFSQFETLVWLFEHMAFKATRVMGPHGPRSVEAGEFCTSYRALARLWGWGRSRVRTWLLRLQTFEMIEIIAESGEGIRLRFYLPPVPRTGLPKDRIKKTQQIKQKTGCTGTPPHPPTDGFFILSEAFELPLTWGVWAEDSSPWDTGRIIAEFSKFKSYWLGRLPVEKRRRAWEQMWRNWVQRGVERT